MWSSWGDFLSGEPFSATFSCCFWRKTRMSAPVKLDKTLTVLYFICTRFILYLYHVRGFGGFVFFFGLVFFCLFFFCIRVLFFVLFPFWHNDTNAWSWALTYTSSMCWLPGLPWQLLDDAVFNSHVQIQDLHVCGKAGVRTSLTSEIKFGSFPSLCRTLFIAPFLLTAEYKPTCDC